AFRVESAGVFASTEGAAAASGGDANGLTTSGAGGGVIVRAAAICSCSEFTWVFRSAMVASPSRSCLTRCRLTNPRPTVVAARVSTTLLMTTLLSSMMPGRRFRSVRRGLLLGDGLAQLAQFVLHD